MNNLVTNFDQILQFAESYGFPPEKKRGIVREYLQSFFLTQMYRFPKASKLSFVGGTSLRLLRNVDRFSEDLDFENLGIHPDDLHELVSKVCATFNKESIETELISTKKEEKNYFNIRFPHILFDLNISTNDKEKVMIKVDQSNSWKGQKPEVVLFSRYGFIEQIVTNPLNQLLVQKIAAYVQRKQTQPRDLYDIVWLYSQQATFDNIFAQKNGLDNLLSLAIQKYKQEGVTRVMKNRLRPFLFDELNVNKIDLLGAVLEKLQNATSSV